MTGAAPRPVELVVRRDLARNRLTVFFRLLLAIPHLVMLVVLGITAVVIAVIGWFAALALGRLPTWIHDYLGGWLRWSARVGCYVQLVTDEYPPFTLEAADHPVRLEVPPGGPLNRWAVLGRIVLVVPAQVLRLAGTGINLFVVFAWFAGVFAGRTPRAVFDAIAIVQRYGQRTTAYLFLLTPAYPWGAFGDRVETGPRPAPPPGWPAGYPYGAGDPAAPPALPPPRPRPSPRPLPSPYAPAEPRWFTGVVTSGGRAIVIIALVLGIGDVARAGFAGDLATGGFEALTHIGTTVQVQAARTDVDAATRALSDGSCDQTSDAYCALTREQDLDAGLAELRDHVRSGPAEGGLRDQVLADITVLRAAAGNALDDGTLLAGGHVSARVGTAIHTLDRDLGDYLDRLQGR